MLAFACLAVRWFGLRRTTTTAEAEVFTDLYSGRVRPVALVTGATGAVGGSVAAAFAEAGYDVVVTCRPGGSARCTSMTAATWTERGILQNDGGAQEDRPRFFVETVDLSSTSSTLAFTDKVGRHYGSRLRIVVNSAAALNGVDLGISTEDGFHLNFHLNVLAYYLLMTELMPFLQAAPAGSAAICNVASLGAFQYLRPWNRGPSNLINVSTYDPSSSNWTSYAFVKAADIMLAWEGGKALRGPQPAAPPRSLPLPSAAAADEMCCCCCCCCCGVRRRTPPRLVARANPRCTPG